MLSTVVVVVVVGITCTVVGAEEEEVAKVVAAVLELGFTVVVADAVEVVVEGAVVTIPPFESKLPDQTRFVATEVVPAGMYLASSRRVSDPQTGMPSWDYTFFFFLFFIS